ncbi:MAG TPA: hypothetical protein VM912_18325, partial [Terriglobales bacterium]|nr:hypothetical protein [Terriglobales bacterium]
MKRLFTTLLLSGALWGQVMPSQQDSATLLFANSDSAAALRESAQELRRNPADANAIFVHMEAARLQLLTREELHDAIALLRITHGADSRARLAADRVRELAVNTPAFRSALPELMALLRASSRYSREISDALLAARADGVQIPRTAHLTSRLTRWQVAGPFGEFSNVDFDRSWPPEQDQLRAASYGARVRESLIAEAGNLELPNYFPQTGVYYAASNFRLTAARKYKITVESDGTFELKLDGKPLLVHDARFHSQKKISIVQTSLIPGEHRLMLKLKASAMPLRVWLEKEGRYSPERADIPKSEQFYLRAANALLDSDPQPALSIGSDSSSIEQTLLADALSQIEQEQKQREALQAAAKNDPNDALAIVQLARLAFESERFGEAITYLARVLQASADYWPAQELKYQIAFHFDWTQERAEALRERLRLHPSCGAFLEAAKLRESSGKRARTYESKLSTCSSKPYPYWERLAERGEHERVLASVIDYARWHSADRRVLEIAIREAVLSSDKVAAARYAQALAHVAPNWRWAGMLANNPESIL